MLIMICKKILDLYRRNLWFCVAVHLVWCFNLVCQSIYIVHLFIYTCVQGHELTDKDNGTAACVMIPGLVLNMVFTLLHTLGSNNERERRIKQYEVPDTIEVGIEEHDAIAIGTATQQHDESSKKQYVI